MAPTLPFNQAQAGESSLRHCLKSCSCPFLFWNSAEPPPPPPIRSFRLSLAPGGGGGGVARAGVLPHLEGTCPCQADKVRSSQDTQAQVEEVRDTDLIHTMEL